MNQRLQVTVHLKQSSPVPPERSGFSFQALLTVCLPGLSSRWAGLHTNKGPVRLLSKQSIGMLNSRRDPLGAAIKALEANLKGLHEVCERASAWSRSHPPVSPPHRRYSLCTLCSYCAPSPLLGRTQTPERACFHADVRKTKTTTRTRLWHLKSRGTLL